MDRYINAGNLITEINRLDQENFHISAIETIIDDVPTADVAPVVHGEWVDNLNCSECGVLKRDDRDWIYNFCPNCGADMRKAVE